VPFYLSGETRDWRTLAHRPAGELAAAGIILQLETVAVDIDVIARTVTAAHNGQIDTISYDELVIATGASIRPLTSPGHGAPSAQT
jgi:NADPH-dependent 2,4-dienoyl-CoA reductase/sulfur reductase-like enzyme